MNSSVLDAYFQEWCERQSPDRVFEWGSFDARRDSEAVTHSKKFSELTPEEKRTMWDLRTGPAVVALQAIE